MFASSLSIAADSQLERVGQTGSIDPNDPQTFIVLLGFPSFDFHFGLDLTSPVNNPQTFVNISQQSDPPRLAADELHIPRLDDCAGPSTGDDLVGGLPLWSGGRSGSLGQGDPGRVVQQRRSREWWSAFLVAFIGCRRLGFRNRQSPIFFPPGERILSPSLEVSTIR